ncbi:unnamed protein product [Caenorhabditis auriculariae]|uniref:GyrI-like small molecule binding domain-containing protein n=1 Tax=Caenorhabditis auriculariae TaxID=2777116 RepID=A0A8S1I0J1_9PELO|nr:unnamed protein product [Caenorhabditis auriculariae]
MIEYVLLAASVVIIGFVYKLLADSGFFAKIEPTVSTSPTNLSKPLVVYYKYHVGAYSGVANILKEAKSLLPSGSTTFGIYYDNPDVVAPHLLQSAVGILAEDGKDLYEDNYAQQLVRYGYEKMQLPKVDRAIQASQPSSGGILSFLALVNRTIGIVKNFISENRLEVSHCVEFYGPDSISIEFPLDHTDDFIVHDYLSTSSLEAKLARRKFDSDEEESESEPDGAVDEEDDVEFESPESQ